MLRIQEDTEISYKEKEERKKKEGKKERENK